jgi:hypothetical protein
MSKALQTAVRQQTSAHRQIRSPAGAQSYPFGAASLGTRIGGPNRQNGD